MKRNYCACLSLFILCFGVANVRGEVIQTVAFSGQQAPGTPAGVTYDNFSNLHLTANGQAYFTAVLNGPGVNVNTDSGLWKSSGNTPQLFAREFDYAPGFDFAFPGIRFRDFSTSQVTAQLAVVRSAGDQVIVQSSLNGTTTDGLNISGSLALWREELGSLNLLFRPGPSPYVQSNESILLPGGVSINSAGNVVFEVNVRPSHGSYPIGLMSDIGGTLKLILHYGEQVPGMPAGVEVPLILGSIPTQALNDAGKIAFRSALNGPGLSSVNSEFILAGNENGFAAVVQKGDQVPGAPTGTLFSRFGNPALDNAGRVFFSAQVIGPVVDDTNGEGIWLEDAGNISLVARKGDHAPDTVSGVNFAVLDDVQFNSAGKLAFFANLTGSGVDLTNNTGIWAGTPDTFRLIARAGDQAPGLAAGVTYTPVGLFDLNATGQVAFGARLPGNTPEGTFNRGIWAQDRSGELQLIVKIGDLLEVAPGDLRAVRGYEFGGFNDRGQVLFKAYFRDSLLRETSGVFISNIVAVPEPSVWALAFLATLAISPRLVRK